MDRSEAKRYIEKNPRAVVCYETQFVYPNPKQAALRMDISYDHVLKSVYSGGKSKAKGYRFDFATRYFKVRY